MNNKFPYTVPRIQIVPLATAEKIATDFIITSKKVGENEGLSKGGYFDDEEDEEETNPNPWDEPLF